jgi:hypothetical protein
VETLQVVYTLTKLTYGALYNLANDPGEQNNVAAQHTDILQKMVAAYPKYASDVGVVIPRGEAFAKAVTNVFPPINAP